MDSHEVLNWIGTQHGIIVVQPGNKLIALAVHLKSHVTWGTSNYWLQLVLHEKKKKKVTVGIIFSQLFLLFFFFGL